MADSQDIGRRQEQAVARFFRTWWPECDRMVRTGYRSAKRTRRDEGDITGLPFTVQVKGHGKTGDQFVPGKTLTDIWAATCDQAVADGKPFGVIIEKRIGQADVADWFAWLPWPLLTKVGDGLAFYGIEAGDYAECTDRDFVRLSVNGFMSWMFQHVDQLSVTAAPAVSGV